jgi:polar amino acid transport system permease protein
MRPFKLSNKLSSLKLPAPWLVTLIIGLLIAYYGVYTTPDYRRALDTITGNPQWVTTDFLAVTYRVTLDGKITRVSGVLTGREGELYTVRTIDPVVTTIPKQDVGEVKQDIFPCPPEKPDCVTRPRITLSIPPRTVTGGFYAETATEYRIQQPDGEIIRVLKVDTRATRKLEPENCDPDLSGRCRITVTVPASEVVGSLVDSSGSVYVVQTIAPEFETFKRSDIVDVISELPGVCALNNLYSCQRGIFLSFGLALTAFSLAVVLGMILALMRISSNPIVSNFATLYVEVVRGIPILAILLVFYFGVGPAIRDGLGIPFSGEARSVLGLSVAYAAFLAEVFRAGIQSIGRGQMEAARSLGMNYILSMRLVILPQAIRLVLPPLGNDFISMLKDTAVAASIAIYEMTYLAIQYNGQTLKAFPAFITLALVYLVLTLCLSFVVRVIEQRVKIPGH